MRVISDDQVSAILLTILLVSVVTLAASVAYCLAIQRSYNEAKDSFISALDTNLSLEQSVRIERQIREVFDDAPQDLIEYKKGKRSLTVADDDALIELYNL